MAARHRSVQNIDRFPGQNFFKDLETRKLENFRESRSFIHSAEATKKFPN